MTRLATLIGIAVVAIAAPAAAHPLDLGSLHLDVRGDQISIALDLEPAGAALIAGVDPIDWAAAAVPGRASALAAATLRGAALSSDRGPCRFTGATAVQIDRTVTIRERAVCPAGFRSLHWPLPVVNSPAVSTAFQILVKVDGLGAPRVTVVDRSHPVLAVDGQVAVALADFVWMGVEHIGAAPGEWTGDDGFHLPDGIDHILFLLALLLGGGTLFQLCGVASGFTLGHSITLALATLGVVHLPGRLIESVIALSIALVAFEALFGLFRRQRWTIAALFGMVHGFGFASALTELDLSGATLGKALVGYNLGVELGQLAIVLTAIPIMFLVRRWPRVQRLGGRLLAVGISCAGLIWFVERAFGEL